MNVQVKISNISSVNELSFYWNNDDYIQLLDRMNFPDADKLNPSELKDMLYMAITDFEPEEAAEIVLTYKLENKLTAGQIQNVANEMLDEKIAEQYSDPGMHFDLFNINQLLFKAFRGKFPNTEASIINLEILGADKQDINREVLTKALAHGLTERSIIQRLYEDQVNGLVDFGDAAKIIWTYDKKEDNKYEVITSKYWIDKEDFEKIEYEAEIKFFDSED